MNRMFAKTEKMKAATKAAMDRLKAMPPGELLAFGSKHADSDLAIFLTESADDYRHHGQVAVTSYTGEYLSEGPAILLDSSALGRYQVVILDESDYFVEPQQPAKDWRLDANIKFAKIAEKYALSREDHAYNFSTSLAA